MTRDDLAAITGRTLAHYAARAEAFEAGTRDHDVTQNLDALLSAITAPPPFTILDFGCGPGRDLVALTSRGHRAIGLDGVASFVQRASDVQRLFRPFTQLDSGLTRRHGGTGLGLYISQRFAKLLGGRIDVQSIPGDGSVFTLVLPRE